MGVETPTPHTPQQPKQKGRHLTLAELMDKFVPGR